MARGYTNVCIRTLGGIATSGESEQARIQASAILLDRGYGKAAQPVTGEDGEGPVVVEIIHRERKK